MQVWGIDESGDWLPFSNQKKDKQAVLQNVITRIKEQYGDCFFDVKAGIDWRAIFSNRGYEDVLYLGVKNTILGTEGVVKLNSLTISIDDQTNQTSIQAEIQTQYDTEQINLTL